VNGRPVFVTGGAGFIGSHTCKQLSSVGIEPVAFDNLSTGHRESVRWGPLVEGDILDTERLVGALRLYRPSAVIHFAASAYVGESVTNPGKYYRNNVAGSLSLLEACRAAEVSNVIFSSSCATYGTPESIPINEETPQHPINPYGRSKLICEQLLRDFADAYGLRFVSLRYFNACGADPDGELGEWHDPETHLIPRALMAAAGRLPYLSVFGNDYDTPDGTCIRDYIHVCDLARAHIEAVRYLVAGGESIALNLGAGRGMSIRDVLSAIERVTGRRAPIVYEPRRPGDPPVLVAHTKAAKKHLGFSAELSDIDTIIRTAAPCFGLGVQA
jgi:UDP-arabinose 4-epimerase